MKIIETAVLTADFWNEKFTIHYYATNEIEEINVWKLNEKEENETYREGERNWFIDTYNSLNKQGFHLVHKGKIKDGSIFYFEREV